MENSQRPLMVYDGDCGFCRLWIGRWRKATEGKIAYLPFQKARENFPEIPSQDLAAAVQLLEPNRRSQGAEAVFRALAYAPNKGWLLWGYLKLPGVRPISEACYRIVARNRTFFSKLTYALWGPDLEPPRYLLSRWLFLRLLGAIYLVAFLSFGSQAAGLIGSHGILPAEAFLRAAHARFGAAAYRLFPTVAWLGASDAALRLLWGAGAALSLLAVAGLSPAPVWLGLWALYLSLVCVGGDFMAFQWDGLLLETGLLAVFLAPTRSGPGPSKQAPPPLAMGLVQWLLFRLMFESGCVKLLSGDPTWRNLSALDYHYFTQPLPTWIGWYAAQLPRLFQGLSVAVMLLIELGAPWLIFMPRRPRLAGCLALVFLQALIALTGNYGFFNALTLALCLCLVDDATWARWIPRLKRLALFSGPAVVRPRGRLVRALAAVIILVTAGELGGLLLGPSCLPRPLAAAIQALAPFNSTNAYGLFAVMTTTRREIIVEGSDDGQLWRDYEFKWKPGALSRRPAFVAPRQPRLDWQMWFAALGRYDQNPWYMSFLARLLEGSPEVLALLKTNPFPDKPPRYVRALAYDYTFTTLQERRKTGEWWKRTLRGIYSPAMGMRPFPQGPKDSGWVRTTFSS